MTIEEPSDGRAERARIVVHLRRPGRTGRRRYRVTVLDRHPLVQPQPDAATAFRRRGGLSPVMEDHVPTPLVPAGGHSPIDTVASPQPKKGRTWRALRRYGAFVMEGLRERLRGTDDGEKRAVRLRRLFEDLGGLWIKVGQLLSLRTDLLSPASARELSRLQYRVAGFPSETAIAVVEEELGRPLGEVFSSFEVQPFAAASICQVHRAVLRRNGRAVVVKVQRPDVAGGFEADMTVLRRMVVAMRMVGIGSSLRLEEGIEELREIMREETDYRFEAANLRRMRDSLKAHDIYVPRLYDKISTERVLVMEYVPGVLMSEYIRVRREEPARVFAWQRENRVNPRRIARHLVKSTFRQILEDNLFHSDLHPGNILLLRDNRIALIDFGTIGSMDPEMLLIYRQVNRAIALKDFARAADYMICLAPSFPTSDIDGLRRDLGKCMKDWARRAQLSGVPYSERAISSMSTETSRVLQRYGVAPSWAMMRVGRALGTLDASLQTLVPDANFMQLYAAYFRDYASRTGGMRGLMRSMRQRLVEFSGIADDARILLGGQTRQRILAVRGMADRVSRLWAMAFGWIRRLLLIMSFITIAAWIHHEHEMPLPKSMDQALLWVEEAFPDLHYIHWLGIIAVMIVGIHILGRARSGLLKDGR